MASPFCRKFASTATGKPKVGQPLSLWARPGIEGLDQRILPTVSAHLNPRGLLTVIADTHAGTSQIEIIQSSGQILVEDGGQVINSFDLTQVQQVDFKYREGHQQRAHIPLAIPINQQQMTLTGIAVGEADLNIGVGSLTAAVSATLPDGAPVSLSGPVDEQGNYDLTGTADISVGGFALRGAAFELTPAGMAVIGTATVGGDAVDLAGAVDGQGSYDLTGRANVTVDDFALDAGFELTNTGLTAAAALSLGGGVIHFAGPVDTGGHYNLTGAGHLILGGFDGEANLTLTNTSLTGTFTVNVPNIGSVVFSGLGDPHGFNLTASLPVVLAGFASVGNANLVLSITGLTASAAMNLRVATVNLGGAMQPSGQFSLTGTGNVSLGGYDPVNGSFTLNNSGATVAASVNIVVATVAFGGAIHTDGIYALTGIASVTLGGFGPANGNFTLNNGGVSVTADVNVGLATVAFSGPISRTGTYALTGTANIGPGGFSNSLAHFTLSNNGCTVSVSINVFVATVDFSGSISPNGSFQLTGSAAAVFAGFSGSGTFTLNNSGLSFAGNVNVAVATMAFTGSIDAHGNFHLTGTASVGLGGFAPAPASFTLTNGGATLSASVNVVVATVAFTGTVDTHGNYNLTGTTNVSFAGFPAAPTSFVLSNSSGVTLSAPINMFVATANFTGSLDTHGNFRLTATANVSLAGFSATAAAFVLTNSGLTVSANVNIVVATLSFAGTVDSHGQFHLTATAHLTFAGFGVATTLVLANSGLAVTGTPDLSVMGTRAQLSGQIAANGAFSLTSNAAVNFGPIMSTLTLNLTNSGFTAHVHAVDEVRAMIGGVSWVTTFRGSFDVGFNINTDGTFSVSGSFAMTPTPMWVDSVTIGFSITNHQFIVRNSQIVIVIWGVTYHPFMDAVDNY
jgi:hypothetical protein